MGPWPWHLQCRCNCITRLITANTRPPQLIQLLGFVGASYYVYPGIPFSNRPKLNPTVLHPFIAYGHWLTA